MDKEAHYAVLLLRSPSGVRRQVIRFWAVSNHPDTIWAVLLLAMALAAAVWAFGGGV